MFPKCFPPNTPMSEFRNRGGPSLRFVQSQNLRGGTSQCSWGTLELLKNLATIAYLRRIFTFSHDLPVIPSKVWAFPVCWSGEITANRRWLADPADLCCGLLIFWYILTKNLPHVLASSKISKSIDCDIVVLFSYPTELNMAMENDAFIDCRCSIHWNCDYFPQLCEMILFYPHSTTIPARQTRIITIFYHYITTHLRFYPSRLCILPHIITRFCILSSLPSGNLA